MCPEWRKDKRKPGGSLAEREAQGGTDGLQGLRDDGWRLRVPGNNFPHC
ncbi:hypothetical protein CBFG_06250 [Clostridiales bacterium 1_7_47FAA]|nr:hypothetical protein CBFG_06250 [Clostridiales bacterium 1_7_47FAA]